MEGAIRFLEWLGQDVTAERGYAALLAAEVADGPAKDALQRRDVEALNGLLGGSGPWFCMVATPDSDEPERPQEGPDEHPGDQEDAPPQRAPERRDVPD